MGGKGEQWSLDVGRERTARPEQPEAIFADRGLASKLVQSPGRRWGMIAGVAIDLHELGCCRVPTQAVCGNADGLHVLPANGVVMEQHD